MPSDPKLVQKLFLQLAPLPPADRQAALDRECGSDAELRCRVVALLQAHDEPDSYLDRPGDNIGGTAESAATGEHPPDPGGWGNFAGTPTATHYRLDAEPGAVIAGRYTLQQKIGEGGMGEVWVARQTEPVKRKVALKLIKTGMDSRTVLRRFEQERQALALMDHPNIARVLDGGLTPSGQPFFVMELVNGLPLNKFCDAAKLTLQQRLELFVPICQAVQHAHQKGIVHRDLKPANMLVTLIDGQPVPKVIDFGVAKATSGKLTEETMSTVFGAVVGTLEYMSPEQAGFSGEDIDTRADIYSLGVILYELLTGLRPIDANRLKKAALTEMIRIIREEEPSKPSTRLSTDESLPTMAALRQTDPKKLMTLLRGELDWVVLKCLEKQRDRRYETANALVRDIQRYLADELVEARPPSTGYRLQKFVRRHKGQVIAVSLVLIALLGGIAGTTWGLFEARRQEQIARAEASEKERARSDEAERVKERDVALGEAAVALRKEAERVKERDTARKDAEDRAIKLKYQLGVSDMVLASAAYDNRDVVLAAERLDKVPPEQRGWEWHYLKQQTCGGVFTLSGHTGSVTCVAYSPDGTRIVTGGGNQGQSGEVKVWDARTGMALLELKGLPPLQGFNIPRVSVTISADGTRIVTGGGDKTARVWDAQSGTALLELNGHTDNVRSVSFSVDDTRIVTGSNDRTAKVWDARTGMAEFELKGHNGAVTSVSFSPDGTRIVTGSDDGTVKVWDIRTGTVLLDSEGFTSGESSVSFSPDGTRIVTGRDDGTATVIDAQTGTTLLELKGRTSPAHASVLTTMGVLGVTFSPDGTRIVTGGGVVGNGEATVWDVRTGKELLDLKGHTNLVMSVTFSPDGTRIVTGSADGTAKVWDAQTGTPRLTLKGIRGAVNSVFALNSDGTRIVTGGAEARVWDARSGIKLRDLKGFKGTVRCVAFNPDGTRIVTGAGEFLKPGAATVWDAQTGTALLELQGIREALNSVSFSPDGTRIVTGGGREAYQDFELDEAEVKVWDAQTGTVLLDLKGHTRWVNSVSYSPDGTRIVTGGGEDSPGMVKVWDARTGAELLDLKETLSPVRSVSFSPDGTRIVTGSDDRTANVWNARTGEALFELKGHSGAVMSVSFSPDGTRIVTGGGDRTVKVWEATTGTALLELKGHAGFVTSVLFSPDGTRIITGALGEAGNSGEVTVWDARIRAEGNTLQLDDDELAFRQLHAQPNLERYREGFLAARAARDDFATKFYLNHLPPAEWKAVEALADERLFATMSKLVMTHLGAGKRNQAVTVLGELLNLKKARLGPEHPDVLETMNQLGMVFWRSGQFDKSVPVFEEVLKIREAKLGRDHQDSVLAVANLGVNFKDAGRLTEAIPLLEEAHRAAKEFPDLGWVVNQLIDAYGAAGENDKAANLLLEQVPEARQQLPNDSVELGGFLAFTGMSLLGHKKWVEAEPLLRESLAIREQAEADLWSTFNTQSMLGGSLLGQKKHADAEPLLLNGYEGMKKREALIPPLGKVRLAEAVERLVQLYEELKKPDEAAKWRNQLDAAKQSAAQYSDEP